MSNVVTLTRFWCRRDTTSNWNTIDPTPAAGEWCVGLDDYSGDVQSIKIGNGFDRWSILPDRSSGGGGIPDAPSDGRTYGRKDGGWVEVSSSPSVGHRYWRIYITATNSSDQFFAAISEVEMSVSAGGANIALGAIASASSSFSSSPPSSATDGNPATFWSTAESVGSPAWLSLDLVASNDVKQVRIRAGDTAARALRAPSSFQIQYSDDNSTWSTAAAFTGQSFTPGEIKSFNL